MERGEGGRESIERGEVSRGEVSMGEVLMGEGRGMERRVGDLPDRRLEHSNLG